MESGISARQGRATLAARARRHHILAYAQDHDHCASFDAIAQALSLGSADVETERAEDGRVGVWLPRPVIEKLKTLRAPGESYSSVIVRLAAEATAGR